MADCNGSGFANKRTGTNLTQKTPYIWGTCKGLLQVRQKQWGFWVAQVTREWSHRPKKEIPGLYLPLLFHAHNCKVLSHTVYLTKEDSLKAPSLCVPLLFYFFNIFIEV